MSHRNQKIEELAGLSLKTILISMAGTLLFGIYIGILLYGENSLTVLNHLQKKKESLVKEKMLLQEKNEALQKKYFELKQTLPSTS
jgi:uncharacterized protein YlxW (UPF0749 family)